MLETVDMENDLGRYLGIGKAFSNFFFNSFSSHTSHLSLQSFSDYFSLEIIETRSCNLIVSNCSHDSLGERLYCVFQLFTNPGRPLM